MPNEKVLKEKQQAVIEVTEKLKSSNCTIVTDYRGLTVAQVTELRKTLRQNGIEFKVIKNTITRRATENAALTELDPHLTGPTAIIFSNGDLVLPAKIVSDFAKKNNNLEVKAGVVEGRVVDHEQIKALAELPSREVLLSMLLSVLQAPMRNFALAVKAVSEKQEA